MVQLRQLATRAFFLSPCGGSCVRSVWYSLLPLAVLLVLAACGPSQREQDLEAEVSALQGQVSGLQSDLAASEAVSGDLESELEQSRVQIGEFEARLRAEGRRGGEE